VTGVSAIAYGNSMFVGAGGHDVGTFTSPDGLNWTSHFIAGCCGGNFPTIAYGQWATPTPGKAFVYAAETTIYSSTDGIAWSSTPAFSHAGYYLISAAYGGGQFVVIGFTGSPASGVVVTSPDGMTWTDRTSTAGINTEPYALAYGGGKFVAVGSTNAWTSTDAATWTPRNPQDTNLMASIAYGGGLFVAIDGSTGSDTITSPDGVTWTQHHVGSVLGGYGNGIAYGNGYFLSPQLSTSTDGVTWTANPYPAGGQFNTAVYGPNGWVGGRGGAGFWTHP